MGLLDFFRRKGEDSQIIDFTKKGQDNDLIHVPADIKERLQKDIEGRDAAARAVPDSHSAESSGNSGETAFGNFFSAEPAGDADTGKKLQAISDKIYKIEQRVELLERKIDRLERGRA